MSKEEEIQKKLHVLVKIAQCFCEEGVRWCVGASLLLYLKGIVDDFHDIDLMVMEEDALRVKELLSAMGCLKAYQSNARYQTKYFFEFLVDGVDIDVMADFVIVQDGVAHDCALKQEHILEEVTVLGQPIPLHSLSLWKQYYTWMERYDKAELLRNVK